MRERKKRSNLPRIYSSKPRILGLMKRTLKRTLPTMKRQSPPSTMTHIEIEFSVLCRDDDKYGMGLEFYPLNITKPEILAF